MNAPQAVRLGGGQQGQHRGDADLLRALAVEAHENWLEAIRYLNMDQQLI
jgi:hypothetical protein